MAPFKFFLDPRYGLMERIHYLRHGTRNLAVVRMPIFRESLSIINKKEKYAFQRGSNQGLLDLLLPPLPPPLLAHFLN